MEYCARTLISGGCKYCTHLILKSWHKLPTCTSKSNITYMVDKEFGTSFLPIQEVRAGSHLLLWYPIILQYSRHRHVVLLNQTHQHCYSRHRHVVLLNQTHQHCYSRHRHVVLLNQTHHHCYSRHRHVVLLNQTHQHCYSRHRHVVLLNQTHHPTSTVILINKSPTEIKLQELHHHNL